MRGPSSSVGIATGYRLDGTGIEYLWVARFSVPVQTGPGAHPASSTMCTGSLPGVKSGQGVTLTPHPLLVPWPWKSIAISLLPLWAVRPVQCFTACTRVHFTFSFRECTVVPENNYQIFNQKKKGERSDNFIPAQLLLRKIISTSIQASKMSKYLYFCTIILKNNCQLFNRKDKTSWYLDVQIIGKDKDHPCTGTEVLYRLHGP